MRSLIPAGTNILALTATATQAIYQEISRVLSLDDPCIVALPPERSNIMYSVMPKKDLDDIARTISMKLELLNSPLQFPKTVIYCQRYLKVIDFSIFSMMYLMTINFPILI